jgi:hypothetical protein
MSDDTERDTEPRHAFKGGVIVIPNPYVYDSGADLNGRRVRIEFAWDTTTKALTGVNISRNAGCQFTQILVGLGSDGRPDTTDRTVDLSGLEGARALPASRIQFLIEHGLATIDDILALQITAS